MVLRFLEPKLHCLSRFLGKITAAGSHPRNFKIRIVWDPDLLPMNPCDVVPEVGGSIKMKIQRCPAPKEDCHGCKGPHTFSNLHISNFIIFRKFYDVFVFVPLFHLIDTKLSAYLQCTSKFGCQLQLLDALIFSNVLWHRRNEVLRSDHKKYPWFHAVPKLLSLRLRTPVSSSIMSNQLPGKFFMR